VLPAPYLAGKRVLVVDDLATNRLILERQTQGWGMAPSLASSGADALDMIRAGGVYDLAYDRLGERWLRNMLLNKWLDYCTERGHRFTPATALPAVVATDEPTR